MDGCRATSVCSRLFVPLHAQSEEERKVSMLPGLVGDTGMPALVWLATAPEVHVKFQVAFLRRVRGWRDAIAEDIEVQLKRLCFYIECFGTASGVRCSGVGLVVIVHGYALIGHAIGGLLHVLELLVLLSSQHDQNL